MFNFCSRCLPGQGDHLCPKEQRVHPEHHSRGTFLSGPGRDSSGPPAHCASARRRHLSPRCHGQTGHSTLSPGFWGASQVPPDSSWSRDGHSQPEHATSPSITCGPWELAWQTASRATGTMPGLAHPWALSKGRAWESSQGQDSGWHRSKFPSRTVGSNKQVCQTLFKQHWHHHASCLTGEFSVWSLLDLKISGTGAKGTT